MPSTRNNNDFRSINKLLTNAVYLHQPNFSARIAINWSSTSSVIIFRFSWCSATIGCICSIAIFLISPLSSSPFVYEFRIFCNSASSGKKNFSSWYETSISALPPFARCSSTVCWPPENACLLIYVEFEAKKKKIIFISHSSLSCMKL